MDLSSKDNNYAALWLSKHCEKRPQTQHHSLTWYVSRSGLYYHYRKFCVRNRVSLLKLPELERVATFIFPQLIVDKRFNKWVGVRFYKDHIGGYLYLGV